MNIIPNLGDPAEPRTRTRYAYLQSGVAITVNLSLFVSKLFLASLLASVAVLTDAFNQMGDVAISAMILIAFRYVGKRADPEHPFGHGRLEQVVALIVASFLVVVAVFLLLQSVGELASPSVQGTPILAVVLVLLAAVKELLARFSFAIAKRMDSDAIRADAWNHRYDAMLTGAIALAIFLASWREFLRVLDPIFGIAVSIVILYNGGLLVRSAGDRLLGRAPSEAILERITTLTSDLPGVRSVHSVSVHDYGLHKAISLTVDVDDRLSVKEAHVVATEVEVRIKQELRADVTVHIEPDIPLLKSEIVRRAKRLALEERGVHSVPWVELGLDGSVQLGINIPGEVQLEEADALVRRLTLRLEEVTERKVRISVLPCEPQCKLCSIGKRRGQDSETE